MIDWPLCDKLNAKGASNYLKDELHRFLVLKQSLDYGFRPTRLNERKRYGLLVINFLLSEIAKQQKIIKLLDETNQTTSRSDSIGDELRA